MFTGRERRRHKRRGGRPSQETLWRLRLALCRKPASWQEPKRARSWTTMTPISTRGALDSQQATGTAIESFRRGLVAVPPVAWAGGEAQASSESLQAEKLVYWGGGRCDTGRMSSTNHDVGATEDAEAEEGQGCRVGRGGGGGEEFNKS